MRLSYYKEETVDGIVFYSTPGLRIDATPYRHTVVDGERFDTLSHSAYGDSNWWWVISEQNDIFLPALAYVVGTTIEIPQGSPPNFVRTL